MSQWSEVRMSQAAVIMEDSASTREAPEPIWGGGERGGKRGGRKRGGKKVRRELDLEKTPVAASAATTTRQLCFPAHL